MGQAGFVRLVHPKNEYTMGLVMFALYFLRRIGYMITFGSESYHDILKKCRNQ